MTSSKNQKLIKNSFIYISLEVFNKGLPFLLLPIFTRFFETFEYGLLSLFLAFINILLITIGVGVAGSINANFYRLNESQLSLYLSSSLFVLVTFFIFNLLSLYIIDLIGLFQNLSFKWVIMSAFIAFSKNIQLVYLNVLRMNNQAIRFGKFQFSITAIDAIVTLVGILFFSMGWEYRAFIMFVVSILASVLAFFILKKNFNLQLILKKEYMVDLLKFGIPLLPHQLGIWIRTGADRFIIAFLLSTSAVGIYSANYQIGFGFALVAQAFSQAYQPVLYRELSMDPSKNELIYVVKRFYIICVIFLIAGLILHFLLPIIAPFIFGNENYSEGNNLITWFIWASVFQGMYLLLVLFILFEKKTYLLSIITSITAIIHISFSFLLITRQGIIGVAKASFISYSIMLILTFILVNKVKRIPWLLK